MPAVRSPEEDDREFRAGLLVSILLNGDDDGKAQAQAQLFDLINPQKPDPS
jgi:hypothetical protein